MAINYTLNIGGVTRRLVEGAFSDVIVSASFSVRAWSDAVTTGSEENGDLVVTQPAFEYSCGGTYNFDVSGLDANTFVDFASVTKDTVKGWLLASEGASTDEEFNYVKASVENIGRRIYEHSQEVPDAVAGDPTTGSSNYVYTPPTE